MTFVFDGLLGQQDGAVGVQQAAEVNEGLIGVPQSDVARPPAAS